MTNCKAGDIVVVKFPFTNLETEKQRPALVLNNVRYSSELSLVTLAMVTSKTKLPQIKGDILLRDWKDANLLFESLLRLSKVATVESSLVKKVLGSLSKKDKKIVSTELKKLLSVWLQ